MGGIRRICKLYGGMILDGVEWVWDYEKDEPRKKSEMTKEELKASEIAKYKLVKKSIEELNSK